MAGLEYSSVDPNALLKLDESSIVQRKLIATLAWHLVSALSIDVTSGSSGFGLSNAVTRQKVLERLNHPQVGDLVYEMSTLPRNDEEAHKKGIGILRSISGIDESTYAIQYGPEESDISTWTNAIFRVIPTDGLVFFEDI